MKKLGLLSVLVCMTSSLWAESRYHCVDQQTQDVAFLTIENKTTVQWDEPWHSAESKGIKVGVESGLYGAYAEWKGYHLFRLVDFYIDEARSWKLALNKLKGKTISAVVYFDNDDQVEEINRFTCSRMSSTR